MSAFDVDEQVWTRKGQPEERRLHVPVRKPRYVARLAFLGLLLACGWVVLKISGGVDFERFDPKTSGLHGAGCSGRLSQQEGLGGDGFDWASLTPSKSLNWNACFDGGFECARLAVPLDYSSPEGEEAAIALIKVASRFPRGHEEYRGPVLFNPGGPGGSGIDMLKKRATQYRAILGDGFDLISFDPRGVGQTTPSLSLFASPLEAGVLFAQLEGSVNASSAALGRTYALAQNLGDVPLRRGHHAEEVARHMSTPVVARDMLSIVHAAGEEKLQYWGFSYGTTLGATFAAMFPDKVGRVVIDGVVDSVNYYQGMWNGSLRDTDAALEDIYHSCAAVGPEKCAIHEDSASAVRNRANALLDRLRTAPVSVQTEAGTYAIVDYAATLQVIFSALYRAHAEATRLMQALADLERGNGSAVYALSRRRALDELMTCSCGPGEPAPFDALLDLNTAIACGDVDAKARGKTLEELRYVYEKMGQMSMFAEMWLRPTLCSGWKISGKDMFNSSFEQATSFPMLLIGNIADPVTPLWNAHKMSRGFKDSVVLTQNSSGHCSTSATSLCTAKAVRSYFINGTLPDEGTVCQVESAIFGEALHVDSAALNDDDRRLLAASEELRKNYFVPTMF